MNIRNADNTQTHIFVILLYAHTITPHQLVKFAKGISENSLTSEFYFTNLTSQ